MRFMSSRPRQYAALAVAAVLLSTGSAYAGGALARNSVGSVQVRNNSLLSQDVRNNSLSSRDVRNNGLTGGDVRNRSLGRADLALGAVPRTYTIIRRLPEGPTVVLNIPGFSRFTVTCTASSISMSIQFGDSDPSSSDPIQQHGIAGSDISDHTPSGAVTVTSFAGGVGFGTNGGAQPAAGLIVRGDYWGRSQNLLAHGTWAWGFPAVPCLFRLQLVIQELATPVPVTRAVPGRSRAARTTCEHSGSTAAYCIRPRS